MGQTVELTLEDYDFLMAVRVKASTLHRLITKIEQDIDNADVISIKDVRIIMGWDNEQPVR